MSRAVARGAPAVPAGGPEAWKCGIYPNNTVEISTAGQNPQGPATKGVAGTLSYSTCEKCRLDRARINRIAMRLPAKFCWNCTPLSSVTNTSNSLSAKVSNSPFVLPLNPASGTVERSWPSTDREYLIGFGTHSSKRIFIQDAPQQGPWLLRVRQLQLRD